LIVFQKGTFIGLSLQQNYLGLRVVHLTHGLTYVCIIIGRIGYGKLAAVNHDVITCNILVETNCCIEVTRVVNKYYIQVEQIANEM
jgi:hypothetical protein